MKWREDLFLSFFFWLLTFKTTKICFESTKMEIFDQEKAFHAGKKSGKMTLPPRKCFLLRPCLWPWSVWFYFLFTIFNNLSLQWWILAIAWKRSCISRIHKLTSSLKTSRPNFIKTYILSHYLNMLKRGFLQRHMEKVRKRWVCSKGFGKCF